MRTAASVVRPLPTATCKALFAQLMLGLHHHAVCSESFRQRRPVQPSQTNAESQDPLDLCFTRISPISSSPNTTTMMGRFSRTEDRKNNPPIHVTGKVSRWEGFRKVEWVAGTTRHSIHAFSAVPI